MANEITNYQCPACTGPLHYSGSSGKLECEYCGSAFDVAEIEAAYAQKEREAASASGRGEDWSSAGEGMKAYVCPSCGAELICDSNTSASCCPYCGNPTVVPGNFAGTLRPEFVIPFKLDKEAALQKLKDFYKGKRLLPKSFAAGNHLEEIQGVYVPFWMFDCETEGSVTFEATRKHIHETPRERITETEYFDVRRAGKVRFEMIPVDASSRMPDDHMDAIEPFDYSELKPFSTAYMPGFLADKFDVTQEASMPRVTQRAENTIVQLLQETAGGYDTCSERNRNLRTSKTAAHYAMLPVWLLSTKWNGQDFLFAMNGQTGKMVGDLPVSKGKYWAWFAGIALPLAGILAAILLR